MDPNLLGYDQWVELNQALTALVLFTALAIAAAMAFLLGHAIIPSLVASGDLARPLGALRWLVYPMSAVSLALAILALAVALSGAISVLQAFYPRFAI